MIVSTLETVWKFPLGIPGSKWQAGKRRGNIITLAHFENTELGVVELHLLPDGFLDQAASIRKGWVTLGV